MTHGDPDQGGRHGDAGLTIGRQGMQPIYDFIDMATGDRQPFFVWYAPFLPHSPHTPPERLLAQYRDKAAVARGRQVLGHVRMVRRDLRRVARPSRRRRAWPRTRSSSTWPTTAGSRTPTPTATPRDRSSRPTTAASARRSWSAGPATSRRGCPTSLASSIDLAPTLLAPSGSSPPPEMQGSTCWTRQAVGPRRRSSASASPTTPWTSTTRPRASAGDWVIEGDWKLILPDPTNEPGSSIELYNVVDDPFETKDRAAEHPDKVEHLTRQINDWWSVKTEDRGQRTDDSEKPEGGGQNPWSECRGGEIPFGSGFDQFSTVSAFCLCALPSAFCLLPSAFCLLESDIWNSPRDRPRADVQARPPTAHEADTTNPTWRGDTMRSNRTRGAAVLAALALFSASEGGAAVQDEEPSATPIDRSRWPRASRSSCSTPSPRTSRARGST